MPCKSCCSCQDQTETATDESSVFDLYLDPSDLLRQLPHLVAQDILSRDEARVALRKFGLLP